MPQPGTRGPVQPGMPALLRTALSFCCLPLRPFFWPPGLARALLSGGGSFGMSCLTCSASRNPTLPRGPSAWSAPVWVLSPTSPAFPAVPAAVVHLELFFHR